MRGARTPTATEPSTTGTSLPLWQLLGATARALGEVQSGHSSTQILKGLDARLKPGVQSLLFLALRQWGRASVIRSLLVSKKPPVAVDQLLCTALALVCAGSKAMPVILPGARQGADCLRTPRPTMTRLTSLRDASAYSWPF